MSMFVCCDANAPHFNKKYSGKMRQELITLISLLLSLPQQFLQLLITFVIALVSGWLLYQVHFPAPYLLGSLFGVWILGSAVAPLREKVGVPRWFVKPVLLGLGVLMGAMFTPDTAANMLNWWPTVVAMIGATIVATAAGMWFLVRVRHYDRLLALLCCMPGGQSEVVAMSGDLVEKDYVVALSHLMRVSLVFCLTPLLLTIVQGHDAVIASNQALDDIPRLSALAVADVIWFLAIAIVGYFAARLIHLPMPHLLGSLLLSIVLHGFGWVSVPRIGEFLIIAQVAIGGAIGARLSRVAFKTLAGYLVDAFISASAVIGVYLVVALVISRFTGIALLNLVLSFIPGGFYEVTLLALLFGFDVAFVTFHHVIRVLLIFFSLAPLVSWADTSNDAKN